MLSKFATNEKNEVVECVMERHQIRYSENIKLLENLYGKSIRVHRLVAIAIAFIPNPNNLPVVNHIDGNKLNNNIENLEWCTQQENVVHALKTGLTIRKKGECAYTARVVGKFLNNVLVKKYNCIDMSKCDGHKINAVRHSIQSGNTHHGFNWKYLDSKPVSRKKYSTNKPFASFKDGEMVKLYNNSIEALEDGLWLSNIYKCIRGGINSYKKLQWKYV